MPARRINSLPALRSSMRNIRYAAAYGDGRARRMPLWMSSSSSLRRFLAIVRLLDRPHFAVARFFQKRSMLSVPPNRVLNVVESQTSTSPPRLPAGGIQTSELNSCISRIAERMWPRQIHRLSSQHVNVCRIRCSHRIVRQMHMKGKSRNASQITPLVQISVNCERTDLVSPFDRSRPKAVASFYRNSESLHQAADVDAKALLTGHQSVAVMMVLNVSYFQVVGSSDVVMGSQNQAGPFALEELPHCVDFIRARLLGCTHAVESPENKGVGVSEHSFIERQLISQPDQPADTPEWSDLCFRSRRSGRATRRGRRVRGNQRYPAERSTGSRTPASQRLAIRRGGPRSCSRSGYRAGSGPCWLLPGNSSLCRC